MACRAAVVACLFLAYSSSDVLAQDCKCKKIGMGVCIPIPGCGQAIDMGVARYDTGKVVLELQKKASEDASSKIGKEAAKAAKAVQDASKILEKLNVTVAAKDVTAKRIIILETGYSQLPELGKEEAGYGLYSYAVLASNSDRSAAFLAEVFASIPAIQETAAKRAQLNIFYVPTKKEKSDDFAKAVEASGADVKKLGDTFAASLYDYKVGRAILNHICNPPADRMRDLCEGDMSRGPYIFTYEKPASDMEPVPPPFLFVDLSDIHPDAFGEFVSAFKAQVKREDISDGAKINTVRLALLQLVLKASDWLPQMQKAVADIVHAAAPGGK
jgi:hypothetical protein